MYLLRKEVHPTRMFDPCQEPSLWIAFLRFTPGGYFGNWTTWRTLFRACVLWAVLCSIRTFYYKKTDLHLIAVFDARSVHLCMEFSDGCRLTLPLAPRSIFTDWSQWYKNKYNISAYPPYHRFGDAGSLPGCGLKNVVTLVVWTVLCLVECLVALLDQRPRLSAGRLYLL